MNKPNAWLAAALIGFSVTAAAHEGKDHGATAKPGTVKKEQKPWGIAGDAARVVRTIDIRMTDEMRFSPDRVEVRLGETVQFAIRNNGKMLHEMVIGTKAELDAHAALMVKFPNMQHEEPYMAHVRPGGRGQIVWTFNRPGEFDFACLIAGHYQAGMVGKIVVKTSVSAADATAVLGASAAETTPPGAAADVAERPVTEIRR